MFIPVPPPSTPEVNSLYEEMVAAGFSTNLQLCLDAGDFRSYDGSGQRWHDLSPNGHEFYLGGSNSEGSSDPDFEGNVNGHSQNEAFAGSGVTNNQVFRLVGTQAQWMKDLHKEPHSFIAIMYMTALSPSPNQQDPWIFGNYAPDPSPSIDYAFYDGGGGDIWQLSAATSNGSSVNGRQFGSFGGVEGYKIIGVSITPANGNRFSSQINGVNATSNALSITPSSSESTGEFAIWAAGGVIGSGAYLQGMTSGLKMCALMVWQGTELSSSNFTTIYNAIKGRYGL